jgi:hypothetical protein
VTTPPSSGSSTASEGRHAVCQPDETGAAGGIGSPDAIVSHDDVKRAVTRRDVDVNGGRLRVLRHVAEHFREGVVGPDLDLSGRRPSGAHVQCQREAACSSASALVSATPTIVSASRGLGGRLICMKKGGHFDLVHSEDTSLHRKA